jgi:hypothetical protein
VFVAALAVDAEPLQPATNRRAAGAVLRLKTVSQSPVCEAELEAVDDLRRCEATPGQVLQSLRRLLQRAVVVVHDLQQQRPIFGLRRERRGQFWHRAFLHRLDGKSG